MVDEPEARTALQHVSSLEGYQILTAAGGREGLDLPANHRVTVEIFGRRLAEAGGAESGPCLSDRTTGVGC